MPVTPRLRSERRTRRRAAALVMCAAALACLPGMAASAATVSPAEPGSTAAVPHADATRAPHGYGVSEQRALAEAKATGKPVQVTSATTPASTLTADPSGKLTLTTTSQPVRKRANGSWVPLNAALKKSADGSISPAATTSGLRLSGGGAGPLAIMTADGASLALTAPFTLPAPSLTGATATYASVLPGVDLEVTADDQGGFSEVLVIKNAAAARNPALKHLVFTTRTTGGISLHADEAGNITAATRGGRVLFSAPSPHMWDSTSSAATQTSTDPATGQRIDMRTGQPVASTAAAPGEAARTAGIGVHLAGRTLTLAPDPSLLGAKNATYPEFIDPTYAAGSAEQAWTTVNSDYSSQSYWKTSGYLQVGYDDWDSTLNGVARSFVRESIPTSLYTATIYSSTVYFTDEWSASCTAEGVQLWLTGGISSSTTWNSQPAWDSDLASKSFAYGYDSSCAAQSVGFDITSQMQTSAADQWANITLGLRASSETNDLGWKQFSHTVTMSTTYDHAPSTPTVLTTSPATTCAASTPDTIGNGDVMLYAQVHDADGGTLHTTFDATETSGGATVKDATVDATAGTTAAMQIPQSTLDTLADGSETEISWNVQVSDGTLSSGTSTTCHFYFDPTYPGAPAVTQEASGYTIGTAASFDITANSDGSTPSEYYWQLNGAAPHTVTASSGDAAIDNVIPTRGTNALTVTAVSSGGNIGDTATVLFNAAAPANAADGDMTGDGIPDLVTAGGTGTGLPSGLWLYNAQTDSSHTAGDGDVITSGTDIGVEGNGIAGDYQAADFNGAQVITGLFTDNGLQDTLVYYPSGTYAGQGVVLGGNGDGSVLESQDAGNTTQITADTLANPDPNGDSPLQVVNGYNADPDDNAAYPDLITVSGDATNGYYLEYYQNGGTPGYWWGSVQLAATATPDGTMDWNDWTIATMAGSSESTDMFLYDSATGALYLWEDFTVDDTDGTATYTSYELSSDWSPGGTVASLHAADITSTGPAVWAVTTSGTVASWSATGLTSTPAVTEVAAQSLLGPVHEWRLGDGTSGQATSAADTGSGTAITLAGNSGTTWDTSDLFDPAVDFNGTSGYMSASTQAVNPASSYTISAWVKPEALSGIVLSEYGTEASCIRLSIYAATSTSGYWRFATTSADSSTATSTEATSNGANNVRLGNWAHLTVTYNSSTSRLTLYVNGIDAATTTVSSLWSSGCSTFALGRWMSTGGTLGGYFDGKIADVQTWGAYMTPTAVAAISGTPGYILFPNDSHQYPSGSSWTTASATMTFTGGVLTITETGSGTTSTTYGTSGYSSAVLVLQTDGNLVIYQNAADATAANTGAIWATGTSGHPGDCMFFQPDGNLVIYSDDGAVLWASDTAN